ncbi:MAG: hypothetical protein IID38_10030 [Planctomycetes bacterium]|nr:hypothetical protein [Planctomycetota bacterium]
MSVNTTAHIASPLPADVKKMRQQLARLLARLHSAVRLLRVLSDQSPSQTPVAPTVARLWRDVRRVCSVYKRNPLPPLLTDALESDGLEPSAEWQARFAKLMATGGAQSAELERVGEDWQLFRADFEHCVGNLPPAVRTALRRGKDELREAFAIRFAPNEESAIRMFVESSQEKYEVECSGGWKEFRHSGSKWPIVHQLLSDWRWTPQWPNLTAAMIKIKTVFDEFRRTAAAKGPTIQDLKDIAVRIVADERPWWMPFGRDPLDSEAKMCLLAGIYVPPDSLRPKILARAVVAEVYPFSVREQLILEDVIQGLFQEGRLAPCELVWRRPGTDQVERDIFLHAIRHNSNRSGGESIKTATTTETTSTLSAGLSLKNSEVPKRSWTQNDLNKAIQEYKARRVPAYESSLKNI